jgi:alpha-L-rhamnosidase
MKRRLFYLAFLLVFVLLRNNAQQISPDILTNQWDAKWITVPGEPENDYGVYLFRKTVDLKAVPTTFVIHVSADNRYKLYVNEMPVSSGPARGDLYHWNFETIDIAQYLTGGLNIISAKVWNEGNIRPEAQISWRTGFILQGNTESENLMNTDDSWKCIRDTSYQPLITNEVIGYFVAGPGEFVDMRKNLRGWKRLAFNDSTWKHASLAFWRGGSPKGLQDAFGWMLVPSPIPQMESSVQRLESTREASGISVPSEFPAQTTPVTIPANTKASLLLDQGHLTNAYLTLNFSNGKDATIRIKYAEALFIPAISELYGTSSGGYMGSPAIAGKGNRNEIKGKIFLGRKDSLISDGTLHQEFTTLYWRTYRYILLNVETKADPLVIDDIFGTFTGYPFQMNASFGSDQPGLQKILDIGWRTARLCAIETYMDCPYYEQLQYIGDTRIQALVSFYNSGDDKLVQNAINQADHSRIAEGITLSRHPSFSPQIIPSFSLWYIGMLHDYWMYRPDSLFIKDKIAGTRQILDFFQRYQKEDGSLINVPYWNFTDWVETWPGGVGPKGSGHYSAIYDLQLLWAYQLAAELEENMGLKAMGELYAEKASQLKETIKRKYWDEDKSLFSDTPEKDFYSQHANALAILTEMIQGEEAEEVGKKLLSDQTLTQATIYFKYYLHKALVKAGLGDDYLKWLDKWHENIAMGLTTWAEDSEISTARSDCHAWGSSPNIEFYRTVLGIDTDAPGFAKVRIEPRLGELKRANGVIPHPLGKIEVSYISDKGKWNIKIILPGDLGGSFIWKGQSYSLKGGLNNYVL